MSSEHNSVGRARVATAAMFFIAGAVLATWAPHIPTVQQRLGIGPGVLGMALLSIALGGILAMALTGYLVHRFGSARVTRLAAVAACLWLPAPVLAPSLAALIAALLVLGAVTGMLDVAMNAQGVTVERRYSRPIMSSLHAQFSIGGLAGAGLASVLLSLGWTASEHVLTVTALMAVAAIAAGPRLLPDHGEGTAEEPQWARPRGVLMLLGLIAVCSMLGEGAMLDWSAVYMRSEIGTGPGLAAAGFAAFSLTMTIGRLFGDALVHRLGNVAVLRIGTCLTTAGLGSALMIAHPAAALFGFASVGIGLSNVVPIVFAASSRVPGIPPGYGLAAVSTVGYCGFLVGPPVIGFIAELTSLTLGLGLVVLCAAVIALLARHAGAESTSMRHGATVAQKQHEELS
ncbi:MFS transporter [Arhodomonas sp. AD133]|uniref:MFS transporter n=1 Tax=Arhodomonas sp. AD133 TaxID=3415009 RepID=UPI003EBDB8CE